MRYTAPMLRRALRAIAVLLFFPFTVRAATVPSQAALAQRFPSPPVLARAAVLMDATDGQVLDSVNAHLHLPMASTTKMMTALVALQYGQLSDRIIVPRAAFNYESDATVMGLHPGQVVTLRDLLYGLLLPSGADAANTIAIHYGGTESHFAELMNRDAQTLGLKDTHFVNAHGLTAGNHYSTAYDLAVLAQYMAYLPDLMKIASARSYRWNGHILTNLNKVMYWYSGVDGIKPGYTDKAGICQVLDARRNGRHVVVVLLNTPDLVTDARNLLNYGLQDYTWKQSTTSGDSPMQVLRGSTAGTAWNYFPASGHFVRGAFLQTYMSAGGPSMLGFPRTEPLPYGPAQQVQYFQNAALVLNLSNHRVTRLPLGQTLQASTSTAGHVDAPTTRATPTPRPRSTSTQVPGRSIAVAPQFVSFSRTHAAALGTPINAPRKLNGYLVQQFSYIVLAYDAGKKTVMLLPAGDRFLALHRMLAPRGGNVYPVLFAPRAVLNAIGWTSS